MAATIAGRPGRASPVRRHRDASGASGASGRRPPRLGCDVALTWRVPMPAPLRPRRSALYMPGSNPRALAKARDLPCDVIIMVLEDAVATAAKERARDDRKSTRLNPSH